MTIYRRGLTLVLAIALGLAASSLVTEASASPAATRLARPPIGMHSMLYLNTPYGAMREMFREAADAGAPYIRLNIELSTVFPGPAQRGHRNALTQLPRRQTPIRSTLHPQPRQNPLAHPHWRGVDEYMALARAYHVRVLAVLTSTPGWMADCPKGTASTGRYRCPPGNARTWGRAVGEIAEHTGGVIDEFEVLNEPDGRWSFAGTPQQYASLLAASYKAIHAANPTAQVVLGGLMHLRTQGVRWMNAMLATPGTYAAYRFDVANIHVRLPPSEVSHAVCQWRSYFAAKGFHGPLWVSETGYPARRATQTDPGYEYGPPAQARWLTAVIPELLADGVSRVFVTERDLSRGGFASEGVLESPNPLTASSTVRRRPSFYAVERLDEGAWLPDELAAPHPTGPC